MENKPLNKKKIIMNLNMRLVELDEIASKDDEILSKFESQFQKLSRLVEEASYRLSHNKPIASALKSKRTENLDMHKIKRIQKKNRRSLEKMQRTSQSIRNEFLSNMRKIEDIHYKEQQYIEEVRKQKENNGKAGGDVFVVNEEFYEEEEEKAKKEKEEKGTIRERVKKMIRYCK